jgi:hypothetical protein
VAWLAAAAAFAEPLTQQQVAMAAAGGPRRALRGRVLALAAVGAGLALVDIAFPALFGLFDRTPGLADLGAAALAHLGCAALGIGLGLLVVPPAARRPNAALREAMRGSTSSPISRRRRCTAAYCGPSPLCTQ